VMARAVSLCACGAPTAMTAPAGERLQQFPDARDLIGLRVHGDLAEDCADTLRQGRDQLRGFLFPVPGAADGLAVDRDYQPQVCCNADGDENAALVKEPGVGAGGLPPLCVAIWLKTVW
jgi:hypothetical protein